MHTAEERQSYVALLRGINVSGQKKILMQDLRDLCESIGLSDVATYVQSGNVVFGSAERTVESIAASIEDAIRGRFGFEVPVIVRSEGEIHEIAASNPFVQQPSVDEKHLCVVFLSGEPEPSLVDTIDVPAPTADRFEFAERHIFLHCPSGFARTRLSNNFFENKLGLAATTRNWKTVNALFDILTAR